MDSNKRAPDDVATLGDPAFVTVAGSKPAGSKNLMDTTEQVTDPAAALREDGRNVRIKIGLELLHQAYVTGRSCLTLLSDELDRCYAVEPNSTDPYIGACLVIT